MVEGELLRDEKGRILPGQKSLNPNGRPKGSVSIISKIRQIFEDNPEYFQEYVEEMLKDPSLRKAIMEQLDGKPRESIDHTTGGKPLYLPAELLQKNNLDQDDDKS